MSGFLQKIVSGGQTRADGAALDFAIAHGIPHGGWCPQGRRAEHGPIDGQYKLKETPSANHVQRTEWNVRDSDGTVVFSIARVLTGGSKKTVDLARTHRKPCLHLSAQSPGIERTNCSGSSSDSTVSGCSMWLAHGLLKSLM